MNKLSVCLAVYNEEENIKRCLNSIVSFADEIIIVDGGSTDNTLDIVSNFDARLIKTDNPLLFHINKQKALDACTGDWILQLDADEEVTQSLAQEIQQVIQMTDKEMQEKVCDKEKYRLFKRHQQLIEQRDGIYGKPTGEIVAFFVARRNYFLGKPMQYAGMYPDGVIRLVKKTKAWFPCKSVHEQIQINGKVSWLCGDLLHYSNPTMKKYWKNADTYTSLLAKKMINDHVSRNIFAFFTYCVQQPIVLFFSLFIRHKGILDGIYGFLFAFFSSLHPIIAYRKIGNNSNI